MPVDDATAPGGTQARVYELLSAGGPLDAAGIAAALGVHHTTVRVHLRNLAEAGLVRAERAAPRGRGRPHYIFRAMPRPIPPYQTLSMLLVAAVRDRLHAREAGRRAGVRAAANAAEAASPGTDAFDLISDEAARLGFDPVVEKRLGGADVMLRTCPFAEVAASDPETICDLHLGVAEGLAEAAGGVVIECLHVREPHEGGCRIVIRTT